MANDIRPTFEVDKEGLRKLLAKRGGGFALFELVQNAWDEDVSRVDVRMGWLESPAKGEAGLAFIEVEDDDPDGFTDLAHAYTLFAESEKKNDAEKRGRFNLGEKLVIAVCERASISTTTGTIHFDTAGRIHTAKKRDRGSLFYGELKLSADEYEEALRDVHRLIVPNGIDTYFNGELLEPREQVKHFFVTLPTEAPNHEGVMRRTLRKTVVALYEPKPGEDAAVYEMGIPVVATGDRWHVNVGQKVPLNLDRDNVTPEFLREVRVAVLNNAADLLDPDAAEATWVTAAAESPKADPGAVQTMVEQRFGDKVVVFDPSDPEANKRAVADGYVVLHSRTLPKGVFTHLKSHGAVLPAGQVTPSDSHSSGGKTLPESKWSEGMRRQVDFVRTLAPYLIGRSVDVNIVDDPQQMSWNARYGSATYEFNYRTLGRKWFDLDPFAPSRVLGGAQKLSPASLLIHELAHEYESDHLSTRYYDALTDIGARLAELAVDTPQLVEPFRVTEGAVA